MTCTVASCVTIYQLATVLCAPPAEARRAAGGASVSIVYIIFSIVYTVLGTGTVDEITALHVCQKVTGTKITR